jgi:N-acetyltransferase 10
VNQALALFAKVVRKISKRLTDIQRAAVSATLPPPAASAAPLPISGEAGKGTKGTEWGVSAALEDELAEAGDVETKALREKQREMISALDLSKCVHHFPYIE